MTDQHTMLTTSQHTSASTANVFGGDHFDPAKWLLVPARTFEDLKVGDVFRAPSRTMTDAHTSAFQAVSVDNHPRHYNVEYAKSHGLKTALIQPLQVLALSAPGASLFTHYVGEAMVGMLETSCTYVQNTYVGDTLYAALEITELSPQGDNGLVTAAITVFNQHGELVLSGHHKFALKLAQTGK